MNFNRHQVVIGQWFASSLHWSFPLSFLFIFIQWRYYSFLYCFRIQSNIVEEALKLYVNCRFRFENDLFYVNLILTKMSIEVERLFVHRNFLKVVK